jgi:capsular exopolysaccharide synthesis family protein
MELTDLLAALRKRWYVLVALALVGAGLGYYQFSQAVPQYRSTSRVFVSLTRGDTVAELVQGSTYTQNRVASFAELATQPVVLDPVIQQLGLNVTAKTLSRNVQADAPTNVVIIDISASDPQPQRAALIANAVAAQLSTTVAKVTPTTSTGGSAVQMTVIAPAEPALSPFSPSRKIAIGGPALIGLVLGFLIALLASRLDTRVRTAADFPGPIERAVLGQIPFDRRLPGQPGRAIGADPRGALAESYRRLRTNLQFVDASEHVRSFVVTSSIPSEGKSTTALNLAFALAEKHQRVLLVDADLRRPSIARWCGLEEAAGLSTVLVGEATLDEVAVPWGTEGLSVIPAGSLPPNPSQLVDSDAMVHFLEAARMAYDIVVIDTPPVLAVADASILARRTDGAVVVAGSRKVRRAQLLETLESLDTIGAKVIGLVESGVRMRGHDRLYGYGSPTARSRFTRAWDERRARRGWRRGMGLRPPAAQRSAGTSDRPWDDATRGGALAAAPSTSGAGGGPAAGTD